MAMRDVASIATLGKVWKGVLGEEVTGTKTTLDDWVSKHGGSVVNTGLYDATIVQYNQLSLHRLAPEWLLRFSPEALKMRTPVETSGLQLDTESYYLRGATTYNFPGSVFLFAGDVGAFHAPLPTSLTIAMQRAREALGGDAGEALEGSSGRAGLKRSRDLSSADYASSESEGED